MDSYARLVDTRLAAYYLIQDQDASVDDPRMKSAVWTIYRWARDGKITKYGGSGKRQARWDLREVDHAMRDYLSENGVPPWKRPRQANFALTKVNH